MIDLHSHILFAVDDGAYTLADAISMARLAVAQGVTVMAATPHGHSSVAAWAGYSVARVRQRLQELRGGLEAAGVPLTIVLGTEIYGEPGALARLQAGALLPYEATHTVLLEFPLSVSEGAATQVLAEFQVAGYRVVLAHPERYRFVQDDPNALAPLITGGTLMQLTGDALLGNQGEHLRRVAELLLTHGLVQLLASDAHGPHFQRMANLAADRARAATLVGESVAEALTRTVPAAILAEEPIALPAPELVRGWRR